MRLRGTLIVLALLLVPGASAGSAKEPEVRDAADLPGMTAADVVAAWVEAEDGGLRVSIQTVDGSQPERYPDFVYWLYFRVRESRQEVGVALGFANDGKLRGFLGQGPDGQLNDERIWRGSFDRVANGRVVDLREERGRPSTWSGVVPWGAIPGLEPGATLERFVAGSARYDRSGREWQGGLDRAESSAVFVAEIPRGLLATMASTFPILVPEWMLPAIVVLCTVTGMGAGYALSRRAPKPPARGATKVPVRTAEPPARGERFQRTPPRT